MSETMSVANGDGSDTLIALTGQDWNKVVEAARERGEPGERIVVNMGPQHPSTHGVLRLILEIEGETVTDARCGIGYLHTGIEKNLEYRYWTQGVTFVTRMDYLSPFFNETAFCLGVEKLLGHHRRDPRTGQRHPGDDDGAQPNLLAPGRVGDRRHGVGRDDADVHRLQGSRDHPHAVRIDHRPADEQRLHPARRCVAGPASRTRRPKSPPPSRK